MFSIDSKKTDGMMSDENEILIGEKIDGAHGSPTFRCTV